MVVDDARLAVDAAQMNFVRERARAAQEAGQPVLEQLPVRGVKAMLNKSSFKGRKAL